MRLATGMRVIKTLEIILERRSISNLEIRTFFALTPAIATSLFPIYTTSEVCSSLEGIVQVGPNFEALNLSVDIGVLSWCRDYYLYSLGEDIHVITVLRNSDIKL